MAQIQHNNNMHPKEDTLYSKSREPTIVKVTPKRNALEDYWPWPQSNGICSCIHLYNDCCSYQHQVTSSQACICLGSQFSKHELFFTLPFLSSATLAAEFKNKDNSVNIITLNFIYNMITFKCKQQYLYMHSYIQKST